MNPQNKIPPDNHTKKISAAILAGGQSSRMRENKALLKIGGRTIIERIASMLTGVGADVVIVADREEEYAFLGLPVIPDIVKQIGPLGGIHAALSHFKDEAVFIISCDLPFIHPRVVQSLHAQLGKYDAVVLSHDDRLQPLCALYHPRARPIIESQIHRGDCSAKNLFLKLNALRIPSQSLRDIPPLTFQNVNTPEDYQECKKPYESQGKEIFGE